MIDLRCGDCLDVMGEIADGSVDAVVTDPPYLNGADAIPMSHDGVARRSRDSETVGNPWGYSLDWVDACASLGPSHWVIFCNYLMLGELHTRIARHAKIMAVFVWRKSNAPRMARPVPRLDCEFIIWAKTTKALCGRMKEFTSQVIDVPMLQAGCFATERILIPGTGKAFHPCQKPLAVVQPFVDRLGEPGAVVLDPFAGTGTTGVACIRTGRHFIGIERDPGYFKIARDRIHAEAAKHALLDAAQPESA